MFVRNRLPNNIWTRWVQAVTVPVRNTTTEVRIVDLKPRVTYQFQFRVDVPDSPPSYSTVITYVTPDIGTTLLPLLLLPLFVLPLFVLVKVVNCFFLIKYKHLEKKIFPKMFTHCCWFTGTPVWPQPTHSDVRPKSLTVNLPKVIRSQRPFVTHYTLFYRVPDQNGRFTTTWQVGSENISPTQPNLTLTGLPPGTPIQIKARANNATDESQDSAVLQLTLRKSTHLLLVV